MTIWPHALEASLITLVTYRIVKRHISNRWLKVAITASIALPLAFASHFILDMIPHWDPRFKWEYVGVPKYLLRKLGPDFVLSILLLIGSKLKFWRLRSLFQSWTAVLAGVASMVPDFVIAFWPAFWPRAPWLKTFSHFHAWCHTDIAPGPYWGMVLPAIFTFSLAWFLTYLGRQPK